MDSILYTVKKFLPRTVINKIRPIYHYTLAFLGSIIYRNPSQSITVIGVTGTKGKSTVTELISHILEADGKKVASLSTIQFKVNGVVTRNLFKMTMPGRFFVQKFLREAVDAGCSYAVIEMTSEGAKQYRHKFIAIDALVFTNLTPEHIESHGSFENYKNAKLSLAAAVATSPKRPRYLVANVDDEHGADFLKFPAEHVLPYSLNDLSLHTLHKDSLSIIIDGATIRVPLVGLFNVYNTLAAITLTRALGVSLKVIEAALYELPQVKGRVEHFYSPKTAQKNVTAIVDYAHTPDSLRQLYTAFKDQPKVCILGNTGGGRDVWKRPTMGGIAEEFCDHIILTNEDPYDENPRAIIDAMAKGITDKSKLEIIMDRRTAIKTGIEKAVDGGYVIISGKGTDPYIMGPNNTKQVWSDAQVAQEELAKMS
ncbi:UDP-N-acetylmuramoyl-L-alanyl-D-glutamate--2,6-diaminopimelate ligase [Patescibacteria group bacterium]|nr:UDP-N-acetylmuramoyl-L-alanyl-D-glutamate--2,6-diaminopimelate ligase [Patescibacteria group bacterium]